MTTTQVSTIIQDPARLKGTEPAPLWYWRQNKVYWPYAVKTSDMIERAHYNWKKDNRESGVTVGYMRVDFNRMCSFIPRSTKEKPIMRATWFYKDAAVWKPYELDICKRLEEALQTGDFTRVDVSTKPVRYVVFSKNEFRQYRISKHANPEGRPVRRGRDGLILDEGRPVSEMSSPRVITVVPELPKINKLKLSSFNHIVDYPPTDVDRQFPPMNKGSYGIIYKGKVPGIKQTVVIKDILLKDSLRSVEEWRIEVTNMARANSPYITIIHGYSVTDTVLAIVMEFIERGDLYTLMHKGKVHFPPFQRLTFALQITLGIAHLHKMDILHRDVKTMNILLTREGVCKLTDFGTAKTLQEQQIFNTGSTGTPLWMAPEVPSGVYHFPADIYSLGVVLYEVFQERLPDWDKKNNRVVLMPNFSTQNLVLGCLKEKPAERISMIYLLRELKKMGDKALKTMEINFASFRHEAMQVPNYRDLDKSFSDISPSPSPRGNDELTLHRSTPNLSRGSLGTLKVDVRKVSELKKGPEKIPEGNESKDSDWNIKISDAENVSLTELENLLNWWCANVDSSKELREQTESQWTQLFGTEEERKQLYSMDENNY